MAVTVVEADEFRTPTTFKAGKGFREDRKGNLIVWGKHYHTIATFRPGAWYSVQVDDGRA